MWRLLNLNNFGIVSNLFINLIRVICQRIVKYCLQSLGGCQYFRECIENYLNGQDKICQCSSEDCKNQLIHLSKNIQINHVANMKVGKWTEFDCRHKDKFRYRGDQINSYNINCPYFEVGCDKAGLTNINIDDHLKDDGFSHSTLLMNSLQQSKNDLIFLRKDQHMRTTEIENLKSNNSNLNNELNIFKKKNQEKEQFINELAQEANLRNIELESKLEKFETDIRSQYNEIKMLIKKNQETKLEINENKMDKEIQVSEDDEEYIILKEIDSPQQIIAPYKWNIEKFSLKQNLTKKSFDKFILSESFYSSVDGYKMCLVVWPNGSSTSNFKCLSVGFHLMEGQNDEHLEWPMKSRITISLMYQIEGPWVHSSVQFDYNSTSRKYKGCFYRPTYTMNKARTNTHFINIITMMNNQKLYRNDSIIFKCSVEETDYSDKYSTTDDEYLYY